MNHQVETYLDNLNAWKEELTRLRQIVANCGLVEEFKWMHPCYTYNKKNIVLIHKFKDYCAILFHKGTLLKDTKNILVQQTETLQSARQLRFTNISEIEALKTVIKSYIYEAIEVEKAGLKVKNKKTSDFEIPIELVQIFKENPNLETAFKTLNEGRQRGYLLNFSKPKQAKTRISRINQNTERILNGKGFNDCICGLSKRLPNCDGSHKQLEK
ncbi:MAG: hypothetical protein DA407_05610 [Bacteroidetes bacterium]|nr:MAG: hypothetical protein DA407_05610 [Bacteroidota bacterium]